MRELRILITGASGEIGQATAGLLRERGHRVAGIDKDSAPGVLTADLRDAVQARDAVHQATEQLGGLDVLVNNAGLAALQDSGLEPTEQARAIMEINFFGTWTVTAAAIPALLETRGRIVNVASMLVFLDLPLMAAYSASKRAVAALADALRVEYSGSLSVVTVYPGYVKTRFHDVAHRMGLTLDGVVPEEPLARVARAIAAACTNRSRRDVAVSWSGAVAMRLARWAPALLDAITLRRLRRLAARGRFENADIAWPLAQRLKAVGASEQIGPQRCR